MHRLVILLVAVDGPGEAKKAYTASCAGASSPLETSDDIASRLEQYTPAYISAKRSGLARATDA